MAACPMLPMTRGEAVALGWDGLDVIIVSGDAYVDHPSFGTAIIGRYMESLGLRVGVIAQPDWRSASDFRGLGRPRLFFGVTAGNIESELARRTIMRKVRGEDHYSPGGRVGLRPDMAGVVYSHRLREAFKRDCPPIVLGGVEASLRRIAYYDYWTGRVKRSVLFDAKADLLVYGMGERASAEIARRLTEAVSGAGTSYEGAAPAEESGILDGIRGTAVVRKSISDMPDVVEIPSYEEVSEDSHAGRRAFARAFREYMENCDPDRGRPVAQKTGDRYVVVYPPARELDSSELDRLYALPFSRAPHPRYAAAGGVPALETVRSSIVSHRGCFGDCSFCALAAHQGRRVVSRGADSILEEAERLAASPGFRGTIADIGGPTANMYRLGCRKGRYRCPGRSCLVPSICPNLETDHRPYMEILRSATKVGGVSHVFVESGIRYDLAISGGAAGFLDALCGKHVCGRLKIAPEHISADVLRLMNKPPPDRYLEFLDMYRDAAGRSGRRLGLAQYFISGHPGCGLKQMVELAEFLRYRRMAPEQVQDFYPAPLTRAAAMFYTGMDPLTGEEVCVARSDREKAIQRAILLFRTPGNSAKVREALRAAGREDLIGFSRQCLVPPAGAEPPAAVKKPTRGPYEFPARRIGEVRWRRGKRR